MIEALLYFFVLKSFTKGDYYHQIITLTLMLQDDWLKIIHFV